VKKMIDLVKKSILLGLGAAELTREKVETLVDELIHRGELAQKERKVAVEEFLDSARRAQDEFLKRVRGVVERTVTELGLPTKADLAKLEERLAALEKKIK
jgi:polyhydroxyalkanoate synthesis regulator phasin